jgi:Kef-type K+ transport system membrane component KefB
MAEKGELLILMMALFTFAILVVASSEIAKIFQKVKLPLITGFILIGVIVGPYVLDMLPAEAIPKLNFINDVALAFIAFAAGSEMFLKELDGKLRNIWIMTLSQFFITFAVSFVALMALSEYIPFMSGHTSSYQIAIAILIATIFIARSPASAIAIINELRAKGPFTKVALGVTIIKDILVILLFTVTFVTLFVRFIP